jgi:hypothetical protein
VELDRCWILWGGGAADGLDVVGFCGFPARFQSRQNSRLILKRGYLCRRVHNGKWLKAKATATATATTVTATATRTMDCDN